MDIEKILDEYRNGDAGCRLRHFLAFRDLRGHFSRIEQKSPNDDFDILKFPWSKNHHIVRAA